MGCGHDGIVRRSTYSRVTKRIVAQQYITLLYKMYTKKSLFIHLFIVAMSDHSEMVEDNVLSQNNKLQIPSDGFQGDRTRVRGYFDCFVSVLSIALMISTC